jgi:hypothetical protein
MQDSENNKGVILETQDVGQDPGYVIYIYNILERDYIVEQPPLFPKFRIPACLKGEAFAYTFLPAFVNERYEKPGSLPVDFYYKRVDGRKCATSLLNPDTFPGIVWEAQLNEGQTGNGDMTGNNLNAFGVFWSLTRPEEPELQKELKLFRARVDKTMRGLIQEGNLLHAAGNDKAIAPLHHFAMEYFNLQAPWHMSTAHMTSCPNCGEAIRFGVVYHRNQWGEKCIVDAERYKASVVNDAPQATPVQAAPAKDVPPAKAPGRTKTAKQPAA